jgi:hypothetical protein
MLEFYDIQFVISRKYVYYQLTNRRQQGCLLQNKILKVSN